MNVSPLCEKINPKHTPRSTTLQGSFLYLRGYPAMLQPFPMHEYPHTLEKSESSFSTFSSWNRPRQHVERERD